MGSDAVNALAAIVSAVVATTAAVYTVLQARVQHRRDDFELARSLHADLTTGAVAEARDVLGTVVYGKPVVSDAFDVEVVRRAHYVVLWCFERVEGGRASLAGRRGGKPNPAVAFLDDLIDWHVAVWEPGFRRVRAWIAERAKEPTDDAQSRAAFDRLYEALFGQDTEAKLRALGLAP